MVKREIDPDSLSILGYFDPQVLAAYRSEPYKYTVSSDYFEGTLTVSDEYYRELEARGRTDEYINIRFGYRTLKDGSLALVVWLSDLFEKSKAHVSKWSAPSEESCMDSCGRRKISEVVRAIR